MNGELLPAPPYSAFTFASSPSTAGEPITPISDTAVEHFVPLDLYDLCDPSVIGMSPTRGTLHHSASYTYGTAPEGQYPGSVSQE